MGIYSDRIKQLGYAKTKQQQTAANMFDKHLTRLAEIRAESEPNFTALLCQKNVLEGMVVAIETLHDKNDGLFHMTGWVRNKMSEIL